jgi:gamma-glutamyl phosphate reductase
MLEQMGIAAKAASWQLALLSSREKNQVLEKIADYLEAQTDDILRANAEDLAEARANGLSEAMLDRLALTPARLSGIASDVRQVCNLADPVGQVIDGGLLDSGLRIERRRVPLGVIGVIYEARPNVTVDVASLCLKTGNAAILRGGKETWRTNAATVKVIQQALQECGLGYRTRYVLHAAQQAAEGTLDLKKLASLPDEALFARLMELDGVGKKVANCVCLFGYGRVGRVPVDVWIERLIRDEFAGQDPFPQFGLEAGIVQQYLFFYKRSVG